MKSIDALCWWLEHTPLSETIQSVNWIVPAVQTVHILAIAVVASSALMIDLRLIGVFSADRPMKDIAARFLPFVWWPLLLLLATGALMITGEPARSLKNPAFGLNSLFNNVRAPAQYALEKHPELKSWASIAPNYAYGHQSTEIFSAYLKTAKPDSAWADTYWYPVGKLDAATTVGAIQRLQPRPQASSVPLTT